MGDVFQDREIDVEQNLLNEKMKREQAENINKKIGGFSQIFAGLSLPTEKDMLDISDNDLAILSSITTQMLTDLNYITVFLDSHPEYVFRGKADPISKQTLNTFLDLCTKVSAILNVIKTTYKNPDSHSSEKDKKALFSHYMKLMHENGAFPTGSFDVFKELMQNVLEAELVKTNSL